MGWTCFKYLCRSNSVSGTTLAGNTREVLGVIGATVHAAADAAGGAAGSSRVCITYLGLCLASVQESLR